MTYEAQIQAAGNNPARLEDLYRLAQRERRVAAFAAAIGTCYQQAPENLLYGAWHYRLQAESSAGAAVLWRLAVPLGLVAGLALAALTQEPFDLANGMPLLFLTWAPLAGLAIVGYIALGARQRTHAALVAGSVLLAGGLYAVGLVLLHTPSYLEVYVLRGQYRDLMLLHLPALAWIAAGLAALGWRSTGAERHAILVKSIEVLITGGLYAAAGGALLAITVALFQVLGISLPDPLLRALVGMGAGVVPVLAVATVYDPRLGPLEQRLEQGLARLIATLMRLLLPVSIVVLAVYVVAIPFNLMAPFHDRGLLIVYNVLLFAVMGVLLGASTRADELGERAQGLLRAGMIALAALATLASLYALAAVVYRTVLSYLTPNRLTVIGWNAINIGLLVALLVKQARLGRLRWLEGVHAVAAAGVLIYSVWVLFLVFAVPWLF